MPTIKYDDGSNATSGDRYLLPPGDYDLTFDAFKWGTSKGEATKDSPTLSIQLLHSSDAFVWDNLIFHPKTYWRVSVFLRACGLKFDHGSDVNIDDALLGTLLGRVVRASVKNETYNGQANNKVKGYVVAKDDAAAPATGPTDLGIEESSIPF